EVWRYIAGESGEAAIVTAERRGIQPDLGRSPDPAKMQQHVLAPPGIGDLKAKRVETLAALPGSRVDGFLEALQRPVRGHRRGNEAAALEVVLIEPGQAI